MTDLALSDYQAAFVQPLPRYAVKRPGKTWRTVDQAISRDAVEDHLAGKVAVASLGRWYPGHALLDFDTRDTGFVQGIRDELGMSDADSLLCTSESRDSYHLLFRPTYNRKPPTLRFLDETMAPYAASKGIEAFPKATKCVRLPFSVIQRITDPGYELVDRWQEKMWWFEKLNEFDLSRTPASQLQFDLIVPQSSPVGTFQDGAELFKNGLQGASTRHESQFAVLYWLWRKNTPYEAAVDACARWIATKDNGYSKDIVNNPRMVRAEIRRQASRIWSTYTLPDETHNVHWGFITKNDIAMVFGHTDARLPRARFLFYLVKYCYPRRLRNRIQIHSDKLRAWSSTYTYLDRIRELQRYGLLDRGQKYIIGQRSKDVAVNWPWGHVENAVLVDERAPNTLEETIAACMEPEEVRAILRQSGMARPHIGAYLRSIYEPQGVTELHNIN